LLQPTQILATVRPSSDKLQLLQNVTMTGQVNQSVTPARYYHRWV